MTIGLMGRKCGMTRVIQENGTAIPVSVVSIEPNVLTQVKTVDTDGYNAVQIATGKVKLSKVKKPMQGHFAKANVEPRRILREFRINETEKDSFDRVVAEGNINIDIFAVGQKVNVVGVSKGKGFAGVIKRHNFSSQDATHGNSLSHRAPGSIGQNQSPGRVFKGKKMAGQLGNKRRTVKSLEIIRVDSERNLLLIKGAIPGPTGGNVIVLPA